MSAPLRCLRRLMLVPASALMILMIPTQVQAQMGGGMGGMGGGGMGGGGMGRGGPPGGGRSGGNRTPAAMARERMKQTDPLAFLLDNKKVLALTKAQQDTFKLYKKELEEKQSPVFKDLEKVTASETGTGGGRGGFGGGGRGMGRGRGQMPSDSAGMDGPGGAGPGASDTVRTLFSRLADIQDAYRDRARAKLDSAQLVRADSIQNAALEKQREKMRSRG